MRRWAEITSFLVGAAAALVLLAGWRVPSAQVSPPAAPTVGIAPSETVELHNSRDVRLRPRPRVEIAGGRDAAEVDR